MNALAHYYAAAASAFHEIFYHKFPEFFSELFRKSTVIFPEISGKIPKEISELTTLLSTNDLNCVDVSLNPTHSLTHSLLLLLLLLFVEFVNFPIPRHAESPKNELGILLAWEIFCRSNVFPVKQAMASKKFSNNFCTYSELERHMRNVKKNDRMINIWQVINTTNRNLSCPAVSQICSLTTLPPTLTSLLPNSTPIVCVEFCLTIDKCKHNAR